MKSSHPHYFSFRAFQGDKRIEFGGLSFWMKDENHGLLKVEAAFQINLQGTKLPQQTSFKNP